MCYQGLVYCLKAKKELLKFLYDLESVQRPWIGKKQETAQAMSCGNTIAMVDLDQFITKDATLIN